MAALKTKNIKLNAKTLFKFMNKTSSTISKQNQPMSSMIPNHQGSIEHLKTLKINQPKPFVYHVELHRPDKLNAINKKMWLEIKDCFEILSNDSNCRVIVLSAAGKLFTAGIDLTDMMKLGSELGEIEEVSRKGMALGKLIKVYQDSISAVELCSKPVISAINGACVGAGVDLITASDIRYCSEDAWFQVKEVDIGMAADVGTLQRLPKVINGQSIARELCMTARKFHSHEAKDIGLISKVYENKDSLLNGAFSLAEIIAEKSPIAVQATKKNMIYSLDHTNQEGLDQIREMNMLLLQSEDFLNAVTAQMTKEKPIFSKL